MNSIKTYLAAFALPVFLASLSTSIINIALPTLVIAFDASFSQVQWVIVAYLVSMTGAAMISASLSDRCNRRTILTVSILLFALSSFACAQAPTINWLVFFRVLQGIAAAGMINSTMTLVATLNSQNNKGLSMGWIGSLSAIGTAAGPTLGGVLIESWGWQAIFLVNVPIALIAFGLVIKLVDSAPVYNSTKKPIDIQGLSLFTIGISCYAISLTYWGCYSPILLIVALACFACFVLVERRATFPIIPISLLKNSTLFIGAILSLLVSTVMMATLIVGPFYLLHSLMLSPWQVGLMMSFGPIIAACFGIPAGKLVDKYGANIIVSIALVLMLLGFSLFAVFAYQLPIPLYLLFIAMVTMGYAIFQTANNTAILFGIQSSEKGLLSGIINLSRNIGLINGATIMGSLFSLFTRPQDHHAVTAENITHGFMLIFAISAGIIAVAFLLAHFPQKQRQQ